MGLEVLSMIRVRRAGRVRHTFVSLLLWAIAVFFSAGACSDAVCDEAVQSMRTCLAAVDCTNADPVDRTRCTTAKRQGEDAIKTMDGVPCVANASDLAAQINQCHPNPATFCKCP